MQGFGFLIHGLPVDGLALRHALNVGQIPLDFRDALGQLLPGGAGALQLLGGGGQLRPGVEDPLLLPGHGDFFLVHPLHGFVPQALQILAPLLHPVQLFPEGLQLLLFLL